MQFLDFSCYHPSDMELWISNKYKQHGIYTFADLNIDHIASIFNSYVAYTQGETKVLYDADGTSLIFLNVLESEVEQRVQFFHELCHPALHVGDQRSLPPAFISLQESQAAQFQRYAAMPSYLIEEAQLQLQHEHYIKELAALFKLPHLFVLTRIEQIQRRIQQEYRDQVLNRRLASRSIPIAYSETTLVMLKQLHKQLASKKGLMTE